MGWKRQHGWKIKRCQISGRWRDGVKIGNAISRRGEGHDMANSKVVRQQRQLKLNGISTGNSRMAKLFPAKLVRFVENRV